MLDLGMPAYLINSTLLGVMAQRLVRTLCPHCKKPGEPPDDEMWRAITAPWRAEKPKEVMAPVGCVECRMTGYRGRIGLFEIMLMRRPSEIVTREADDSKSATRPTGRNALRVSGATKVAAGLTTADEVAKVVPLA
jgi:general secretion pathway protein E